MLQGLHDKLWVDNAVQVYNYSNWLVTFWGQKAANCLPERERWQKFKNYREKVQYFFFLPFVGREIFTLLRKILNILLAFQKMSASFGIQKKTKLSIYANFFLLIIWRITQTMFHSSATGCSLFIKYWVFSKIFTYIPDSGLSRLLLSVLVMYTMAGQTPALQQNWQSSEKSKHFKEINNI